MTRKDLIKGFKAYAWLRVRHKNMRTVEFLVTNEEESVYQKLFGWWINKQTGESVVHDILKIKKDDLKDWQLI